jgi:hypothetical protein
MDQIDAEVGTTTRDAPVTLSPTDAALIGNGNEETGLWLWHGEALPRPSLPKPESRRENILARMIPAARWAGWIALPGSLALTLLAVSVMRPAPPHGPESANAPTVAPPPVPSPMRARPIAVAPPPVPAPTVAPPIVVVPPAQLPKARLDRVQVPSAPTPQISGPRPERRMAQWRSQRKSPRIVRKTHASRVHRGPPILFPGVLTPPVMTWHGGGY